MAIMNEIVYPFCNKLYYCKENDTICRKRYLITKWNGNVIAFQDREQITITSIFALSQRLGQVMEMAILNKIVYPFWNKLVYCKQNDATC